MVVGELLVVVAGGIAMMLYLTEEVQLVSPKFAENQRSKLCTNRYRYRYQ